MKWIAVCFLGLVCHAWVGPAAFAQPLNQPLWIAEAGISLESAIRIAQQRYRGKVLGARLDANQNIYKIKIVSAEGRVQQVWIDSRSGQIVSDGD
jgi:hypothetical protein